MTSTDHDKPMNPMLRRRLGLRTDARASLAATRGFLRTLDAISSTLAGRPFFGLRESEAMMADIAGLTGPELVGKLLTLRGETRLEATGQAHVPADGPVILAATHPTGMFDYVAHAGALLTRRPDLKLVATDDAQHFLDDSTLIAVRVDARYRATSSRATLNAMRAHLAQGGALLVFGSGRVSHQQNGQLVEPPWRGGPTRISALCNAPLVPAALNARNSNYYYYLRAMAQRISGDEHKGALFGSVRHFAEFMDKLGGRYEIAYGQALPPGTPPEVLKHAAGTLIPGLYTTPV